MTLVPIEAAKTTASPLRDEVITLSRSPVVSIARDHFQVVDERSFDTIEIVVVPSSGIDPILAKNIGIDLDENHVLEILFKHYRNVSITLIKTYNDLLELAARRPNLVFSGVKYFDFDAKQIWLNDFLDQHQISYIASNRAALDREFDKAQAKHIMIKAGIATAGYFLTRPGQYSNEHEIPLAFPLFVKPVAGGDSQGVDANSIVNDFRGFERKVQEIYDIQGSDALIETYLAGREYSVGILEDCATGTLRAMPIEIIAAPNANGDRILDFVTKKSDKETVEPVSDILVRNAINTLAMAAFRALGGKSLGRIDIKMDHKNIPHFIEANLMPGLRKGYFYRGCQLNLQMGYEDMIWTIAKNGIAVPSS